MNNFRDKSMEELLKLIEKAFADWESKSNSAKAMDALNEIKYRLLGENWRR